MLFTSSEFVWLFLVVLITYWACQHSRVLQNKFLIVASYTFYGYVSPYFCILLASSTVIDFVCGKLIDSNNTQRKLWLIISISANLSILGFFKYFDFFIENVCFALSSIGIEITNPLLLNIIVPVGISFYTFQSMSYTIDIYRGNAKPVKSLLDYTLYVCFFPQLVAGPIERVKNLIPQIQSHRNFNGDNFVKGVDWIVRGLMLKLVIANNVAIYVEKVYMLQHPSLLLLAVGTFAFAIQIYTDFYGYTLIARGCAEMLGFRLSINFDSPYLAVSPSDFWRRWHISLSSYVRDYLYIPLGGSRSGRLKHLYALGLTMLLMGLWHGAAWKYVVWGGFHGLLLVIYHSLGLGGRWRPRGSLVLAWLVWFLLTLVGWSIFRSPDLTWLFNVYYSGPLLIEEELYLSIYFFLAIILWSTPLLHLRIIDRCLSSSNIVKGINLGLMIAVLIVFSADSTRAFIYFQF